MPMDEHFAEQIPVIKDILDAQRRIALDTLARVGVPEAALPLVRLAERPPQGPVDGTVGATWVAERVEALVAAAPLLSEQHRARVEKLTDLPNTFAISAWVNPSTS